MKRLALPLIIALAVAAGADAQSNNRNKDRGGPQGNSTATVSLNFGASAEREIRSYFQTNHLAPQNLPPGIAKNLARGKALPPGIAKRALPGTLVSRLPTYPDHEVVIVDRDVMLVNIATQVIVDILTGVL